jgi:hypothetical protein
MIVFAVVLTIGIFMLFLMLWIFWVSCWYYCCWHWLMAINLTFSCLFFLIIGSVLTFVSNFVSEKIANTWASGKNDLEVKLRDMYTDVDKYYCVNTGGCYCRTPKSVSNSTRTYYTTTSATSSTVVTKFQDCTSYVSDAFKSGSYAGYSVSTIIKILNLFGDLEQSYSCSGVCTPLPVYYFSDSYSSFPTTFCFESYKTAINEFRFYGISFIVVGSVMFLIWLVQYGLCCRKTPPGQGVRRF